MRWKEISLTCKTGCLEKIEEFLTVEGALSITYQGDEADAIFAPGVGDGPLWDTFSLIALFSETHEINTIVEKLQQQFPELVTALIKTRTFADQDWTRSWMDAFKPMTFGRRLLVLPNSQKADDSEKIPLFLDPGLAFGTGTHPTTALCLEWLDQHIHQGILVVDYGTGSGILAIAAKKLGAQKVIAIDNDPQAITATRANAHKNRIGPNFLICLADQQPEFQADILIANILSNVLVTLASKLTKQIKPGGKLALSGILSHQANTVISAYEPHFSDFKVQHRAEWVLISATKR